MAKEWVLITGASTGIGFACAQLLAEKGYWVFAGVRKQKDADKLAKTSNRICPVIVDVAHEDQIIAAVQTVKDQLDGGTLKAVVNNAGIGFGGPVELLTMDVFRRIFEVNFFGLVTTTKAFLPLLHQNGNGRIVNISSVSGRAAFPFLGPYTSSKYAVEGFSDVLRMELDPLGICVALIEPGTITTEIFAKSLQLSEQIVNDADPKGYERYRSKLDRFQRVLDIAEKTGIAPVHVAKAVFRAITCERPKIRYLVGKDARLLMAMKWLLPDCVYDWLVRKFS